MLVENKESVFKIGDTVQIVNHKFPNINPIEILKRSVSETAEQATIFYNKYKKSYEDEMHFYKNMIHPYEVIGISYLGMIGKIIKIDDTPRTKYEIETGDIAKYIIQFITDLSSWKNKRVTLFPSQVEKINI